MARGDAGGWQKDAPMIGSEGIERTPRRGAAPIPRRRSLLIMVVTMAVAIGTTPATGLGAQSCVGMSLTGPGVAECTVPANVTGLLVQARGASGGSPTQGSPTASEGAAIAIDLPVVTGLPLKVTAGGEGSEGFKGEGGFNGGGSSEGGFGGGGASDVREATDNTPLVIAGGGGGAGYEVTTQQAVELVGGNGGSIGEEGSSAEEAQGGGGGTASKGGHAGIGKCRSGTAGVAGLGGTGGGFATGFNFFGGGGGGGGRFGGGGGGAFWEGASEVCPNTAGSVRHQGGGGGGSSFVSSQGVHNTLGAGRGKGSVTIWAPAPTATKLPTITGTPTPGQVLSGHAATWSWEPTSFRHQWFRCNAKEESCSPIGGATEPTYLLSLADAGSRVAFTETAANFFTESAPVGTIDLSGGSPMVGHAPAAITAGATGLVVNGATLNGAIEPNWLTTTVAFQYGASAAYGVTTPAQTVAASGAPAAVSAQIGGLAPATTYDYRVAATNALGTVYGENQTFTTAPPAPVIKTSPTISGTPVRGQALSASQGTWTNAPTSFAYQWESCDSSGNNCAKVSGATNATHTLTQADVGHALRAVVTAANLGGSTSTPSTPSSIIGSVVDASMTWKFAYTRRITIVELLAVHELPAGASIEVLCHGVGCPFALVHAAAASERARCHKHHKCSRPKHTASDVSIAHLFSGRRLSVGSRIRVAVVKPTWVGKSFLFTMRSNKTPQVQIACLAPGSSQSGVGC
jgi:hypothetical protein